MPQGLSLQDELEIWRRQRSSMRFTSLAIALGLTCIVVATLAIALLGHSKAKTAPTTAQIINPAKETPAPAAAPASSFTAYINSSNGINLRSSADASSSILVVIPYGSAVTVDKDQDPWYHASFGGKTGYLQKKYTVKNKSDLTP